MKNAKPPLTLDPRLAQDTYVLGQLENSQLLLMRNALFPWFVIVPHTLETELYKLPDAQQAEVLRQINLVSRFVEENYSVDKLNIGAIGNIVSQLHIHIVGRKRNDECWPRVVWGVDQFVAYTRQQVAEVKDKLQGFVSEAFIANGENN